jgi:hypothetical protein
MDNILAIFDHEENLVFPTELIAHLLNSFEGNFLVRLPVLGLEHVALMVRVVPKQPEPMIRLIL